jgi:hypothetical protein
MKVENGNWKRFNFMLLWKIYKLIEFIYDFEYFFDCGGYRRFSGTCSLSFDLRCDTDPSRMWTSAQQLSTLYNKKIFPIKLCSSSINNLSSAFSSLKRSPAALRRRHWTRRSFFYIGSQVETVALLTVECLVVVSALSQLSGMKDMPPQKPIWIGPR